MKPLFWQLVSFALFFGLWEIAGRWPISYAFPPFSQTLAALLGMIADGSLPRAYLSTLQPLIIGIVAFIAITLLLMNLVVDIAYAYLDPRVRY